MALTEERPGVWRGDLWHQGRRTKLTFRGTAKEAKVYEAQKRLEIEQRGIVKGRDVLTFAEFLDRKYELMAKIELGEGTWKIRVYKLKPLRKHFGSIKLTKLTEQHIEAYKQWRRRSIAKETVNGELNVLSAVLTYARNIKVPCATLKIRRFRIRKSSKGNIKVYSRSEVGFILAASAIVAPKFVLLVKFLFETGCRKSEAINLRWRRVDLDRGLAKIWNEVDEDDDDDETEGTRTDGDASYTVKSVEREVPLSDELVVALKEWKLKVGTSEWVFPVTTNRMGTRGGKYAEFPDGTWARVLDKATELARAEDPKARTITGGPHRCRHTYASHYLKAKPDLFALGRLLGHSHVRVTEIYGHLLPGHLDEARNVVTFEPAAIGTTPGTELTPRSE